MTKISAYQTADGKIFDSKLEAIKHDFFLALRGVIQEDCGSNCSYDSTQAAKMIVGKSGRFAETIRTFREKIRREQKNLE